MKTVICKACLFIIFIGCSLIVTAQIDSLKIDSLKKVLLTEKEDTNKVKTLNQLSHLVIKDRKNAMQYAQQALVLSQKLHFENGEGIADYNYARALEGSDYTGERGSFDDVLKYYNQAIDILKKTGNQSGIADCYLRIGNCFNSFKQNSGEFIKNTLTALHLYETIGNRPGMVQCFESLGSISYALGNDSAAIKYANEALNICKEISDSAGLANMSSLLGSLYLDNGYYSASLAKHFYALKIYQLLGNRAVDYGIPYTYGNIGDVYTLEGDDLFKNGNKDSALKKYKVALTYYDLRLKLEQEGNMSSRTTYEQLGYLYVSISKTGSSKNAKLNLQKAQAYYEKTLQIAKKTNQKGLFEDVYYSLSVIDTLSQNYKQAYEHYKLYIVYRDSLTNEETTKKAVQANMQYDFDKKEATAKAAQDKKDLEAKRIKNQQFFTILALGVVILAVIVIALIQFRNNKQKQKANRLLERQKQKVESTLTELKSTQAQLIQSEKMASLGELTAGIAHEIQNPLNFVNNFSEINQELISELVEEVDRGNIEEVKAIANDIKDNEQKINHHGKRADTIVKGMLQHSHQTKGIKEPTDINALCDEYLRLSYHGLRAKDKSFNADFKTDFHESIGKINIVTQDIGRVLSNLFNNAFYAVNEKLKAESSKLNADYKPLVSIQTKKLNNKVEIVITDNGNGIPRNIVDKIFQPFFTTKPTGEGTGLGLSLAYDIITKEHNGSIKVESREGEGSRFIIVLSF